jgi:hypothetical protein
MITGHLQEYKFNLVHHLAGPSCPACDLDFLEVRYGKLAAILEVKKWGRSLSYIQKKWYPQISAGLTKIKHQVWRNRQRLQRWNKKNIRPESGFYSGEMRS